MRLQQLLPELEALAPLRCAEPWDNVGLLTGDGAASVDRVMLTIDATREVFAEARAWGAQLLLSYHPLLLKPVRRLGPDDLLYVATQAGMAVYSPHTALDAAPGGTNDTLASLVGLGERRPLQVWRPADGADSGGEPRQEPAFGDAPASSFGQGRVGDLPAGEALDLPALAARLRTRAQLPHLRYALAPAAARGEGCVRRVACAAGAGDSLVPLALTAKACVLVTGELRHHTLLACMAAGLSVVLLGHDGSERPALPGLQKRLVARAAGLEVACSQQDASRLAVLTGP